MLEKRETFFLHQCVGVAVEIAAIYLFGTKFIYKFDML
jgi:hypothetical protein